MQSSQPNKAFKICFKFCAFIFSILLAGQAIAQPAQRFIIKYKDVAQINATQSLRIQNMMSRLSSNTGLPMVHLHEMGLKNQHVIQLVKQQSRGSFQSLLKTLRSAPNVVSVEEDVLMQPNLVPNDEFYSLQWHYFETTGGMNAQAAWDTHNGAGVVVAIIDTGITNHSDLNANVLPGYDFISDLAVANDGDLRDADASDPGDWVAAFECGFNAAQNSSWHGTHTAGTVAAITDNTQGVAGVAYGANILPVRVLGKCGGFLSDIADAIIWASGASVSGVPDNANPAQVINMSLGGGGSCGSTYQDAIDIAVANGTTVVVSAGNSSADAVNFRPASCNSVITVAANDRGGNLAFYSNFGAIIDVTAPGGETAVAADGVASTLNDGTTTPGSEIYVYYQGTSMSAPHVAGAAALLYQADPNITPAEVEQALVATSRPMPGSCTGGCGAGIIDARAAIDSLGTTPNIDPIASFTFSVNNLDATFIDTSSDSDGNIVSWSWDFDDGGSSTQQNPIYGYATSGTYSVTLTVTDDDGATDSTTQNVTIDSTNVAPISSFTYTIADLQVTFSDGSSDSDGSIVSWSWDFDDGNTSTEQNPVNNYATGGSYNVSLTVTDNQGASHLSSQTVTVVAPNIAPVADFSFVATDLSVDFTDTSSDSDGTIASWSWDFGDGNSSTIQNPNNSYASTGSYTVTLTVTDDQGATASSSQNVSVTEGGGTTSGGFTETNVSPAFGEMLSYSIDVPANADSLVVDTSGGDGDVDLAINFGSPPTGNNNVCLENGPGNLHNCTVNNPQQGTWFIIVRGGQASTGVQLDAYWFASGTGNIAPDADFGFTTNDLEASFTDNSTDSDGSIVSWNWDFGDGSNSTEQNPVYIYSAAGSYTVILTVTDDQGATGNDSQTVTVSSGGGGNSGGFTITGISPSAGQNLGYTIEVPSEATSLVIDTSGGTGNVDLAVNFGSSPTPANNNCIEQGAGNVHNCTLINPAQGTWYIIVRGASTSADVQLDAYWFD